MKDRIINFAEHIRSDLTQWYADKKAGVTAQERCSYNVTNRILLSFDDSTEPATLYKILQILDTEQVKVAFFIIGSWAEQNPEVLIAIKQAGHWLGNHTYSHANLLKLSDQAVVDEIDKGPKSTLLRPPYGAYNSHVRNLAAERGYRICHWSIDSEDWKGINVQRILARIDRSLSPGACILLHLNAPFIIETLPSLIDLIRRRGFELCSDGDEIC